MQLPVSVRTRRSTLHDIARTPHVGGWLILLVALGPPTALGLVALIADAIQCWTLGTTWGVFTPEAPFLGPLYPALMFGVAVPYNALLAFRFDVAIRIAFLPAWAFALGMAAVSGAV
ncbi:MAG: hypothetical protein AAF726_15020 [Planctomycetota bacterium]